MAVLVHKKWILQLFGANFCASTRRKCCLEKLEAVRGRLGGWFSSQLIRCRRIGLCTRRTSSDSEEKRLRRAQVAKDKYRSWASSEQEVAPIGPQWMSDESGGSFSRVTWYTFVLARLPFLMNQGRCLVSWCNSSLIPRGTMRFLHGYMHT